jgi:hypothetical protein
MSVCLFFLAIVFFGIGLVILFAPERGRPEAPLRAAMGRVDPSYVPVPSLNPNWQNRLSADPQGAPPTNAAPMRASAGGQQRGTSMEPVLKKLTDIRVGQRIRVPHPVKGELTVHVLGRILYNELWQESRGPQSPWVNTGNQFAGFWLDGEMLLLNWLTRFYLLDTNDPLTDTDIARDFAPHAKKFAQSDQTADVFFAYPPASWKIVDIGKFQVAAVEGTTYHARTGAIARFIHGAGDGERALVVEDYEGGSGEDCAWIGYSIKEEDIKPA